MIGSNTRQKSEQFSLLFLFNHYLLQQKGLFIMQQQPFPPRLQHSHIQNKINNIWRAKSNADKTSTVTWFLIRLITYIIYSIN